MTLKRVWVSTIIGVVGVLMLAGIFQCSISFAADDDMYFTEDVVKNVHIRSVTASSHLIAWNPMPAADGYYVYCSSQKSGEYTYIGYTTGTSLKNTGLKTGMTYFYKVQAVRMIGDMYYYSPVSSAVMKKAGYPRTPNISLQKVRRQGKKVIIVRWSNISDADHIQLFRKRGGQSYKKILDKKVTKVIKKGVTISYVTTKGNMSFKVRTYNKAGGSRYYSKFSNEKKVKLG